MYYKVLLNGKVVDVLDELVFVRYQKKHNRMLLTTEENAEAILSSDRKHIWHENSLLPIPVDGYDTIELKKIDKYEYDKLKMLHCASVEEIIDQTILNLIEGGIL